MKRKQHYDEGAYSYRIDDKHKLVLWWDEHLDKISIFYRYTNSVSVSTFAERSYKKSTLAEMRSVFEYLVDYYRSYRER